jgi:hypothetical protein
MTKIDRKIRALEKRIAALEARFDPEPSKAEMVDPFEIHPDFKEELALRTAPRPINWGAASQQCEIVGRSGKFFR